MPDPATLHHSCPAPDELAAFCRDELDEKAWDSIAAHLDICSSCAGNVESIEAADDLVQRLRQPIPAECLDDDAELKGLIARGLKAGSDSTQVSPPNGRAASPSPHAARPSHGMPSTIGPYEVLRLLGRGGMGAVYQARHPVLRRLVAIKVPLAERSHDNPRFLREARAAAALRHPNICAIHEVGQTEDFPYIVLAYIEGETLDGWVAREKPSSRSIAEIVGKIARAIQYAHDHGFIHRDLKPSNVMLETEIGEPVLMDFGLAKELGSVDTRHTQDGDVLGTPAFMSPEQASGRLDQIGPATDVYALGAVLYALIAGRPPFSGPLGEVLRDVQTSDPMAPRKFAPQVHVDLETICLKAMAKSPADRYESAAAMADDLDRFAAGEAILARREPLARKLARHARRHAGLYAVIAAAMIVVALSARFVWFAQGERQVSALINRIESEVAAADWSNDRLATIASEIAALEAMDPTEAEAIRQRVANALDEFLRAKIEQPRLDQQLADDLQHQIAWLDELDPVEARRRGDDLQQRLRRWQSIFQLTSPVTQLPQVAGGALEIDDGKLRSVAKTAEGRPIVLLDASSPPRVRAQATFDGNWEDAATIGFHFDAPSEDAGWRAAASGHVFIIRVEPSSTPAPSLSSDGSPKSFRQVREHGGSVHVQIFRGPQLLRQQSFPIADLPRGALSIKAQREGSQLKFRVASRIEIEFEDVVAIRPVEEACVGIYWPGGGSLASLTVESQLPPRQASPLEQADARFIQGDFASAAKLYQQQAESLPDGELALEARCKAGLCHIELKERPEAIAVLRPLAEAAHGRWAGRGLCALLLLLLDDPSGAAVEEADYLRRLLETAFTADELATVVAEEERVAILKAITGPGLTYLDRVFISPKQVEALQRSHRMIKRLGLEGRQEFDHPLMTSLLATDLHEESLEVTQRFHQRGDWLGTRYRVWLLTALKRYDEAMLAIDQQMFQSPGVYRPIFEPMLLERARVYANQGKIELARADLDTITGFQQNQPAGYFDPLAIPQAWLLKGLLAEQSGNAQEAAACWKQGVQVWRENFQQGELFTEGNRQSSVYFLMLASLADDFQDRERQALWNATIGRVASSPRAQPLKPLIDSVLENRAAIARVFEAMWRTPRGKQWVRKISLYECTPAEAGRIPLLLAGTQFAAQSAFARPLTPDEDELLWQTALDMMAIYLRGEFTTQLLVQGGLAWQRIPFAWNGVRSALAGQPQTVRRIAWLLGHRYAIKGAKGQAAALFREAAEGEPADSTLRSLATTEADRLRDNR